MAQGFVSPVPVAPRSSTDSNDFFAHMASEADASASAEDQKGHRWQANARGADRGHPAGRHVRGGPRGIHAEARGSWPSDGQSTDELGDLVIPGKGNYLVQLSFAKDVEAVMRVVVD